MVDIMTSPSAELSKDDEFEDGELPEDGEIQDDEDEPVAPASSQLSPPVAVSPQRSSQQPKKPAPRGYGDDLEVSNRNIWGSPEGNVEYNGPPGGEDRDYRLNNDEGDFGDMDFRQGPMSRRRKMSPPMDDFDGPRGPRGRPWRGGFKKPKWATEHQICKFFREGYCRDGDQCTYSHQAEDSLRKPELCRFYSNGYCKKGLTCLSLHGEFPCLPFHKGECTMEHCRFSHLPLNEYTRPLYDQRVKDEELGLTGRNPHFPPGGHHAARRRVLLPHGPELAGPMSHPHNPHPPAIHAPLPPASNGHLPPPAVVVPTIANNGPPHPPYPQMPPRGSFFPAPALVHQPSPHLIEEPQLIAPAVAPAFDISSMLAKIAGENIVDDSPASPPLFGETSTEPVRSIPEAKEITWRLILVDAARAYAGVDSNNLSANDPRISKIIASQFDAVSNMFATTEDPRIRDPRRRPDEKKPSDDRPRVSSWMPQLA